jgi:glutamate synthase (NADPH/NADH) large chain
MTDERFTSAIGLVHFRFSTNTFNTFPAWPLTHPFRYVAHNGEINTVVGNRNWMRARVAARNRPRPGPPGPVVPDLHPAASHCASFDEVLKLLYLSGRSLPHG